MDEFDRSLVPEAVELIRVRLDLLVPFAAAHGAETVRDVILIKAVAGDGEGWGECSTLSRPGYTSEYTDGAWQVLRDDLVPGLLAGTPPAPGRFPMARAGLDTACLDLDLKDSGRSMRDELGGWRTELPTTAVVGICPSIETLIESVEAHVASGVACVKLKISPGGGVGHLRAVRDAWPDLPLAADANGSFGDDVDAVPVADIDRLDLAYLEQPFSADALDELAALVERLDTPVALDETATSVEATARALDAGCGRVVNVKPARVGGVREATELVALCEQRGVHAFVGGMLETGVGRATALAVASLDGCTMPTDLGPSGRYFAEDITEPIVTTPCGLVRLPTGPGIGVAPLEERLSVSLVEAVLLKS